MKNIPCVPAADDVASYAEVVKGLYRPSKTSVLGEKGRVDAALTGYLDSMRNGTAAPLGFFDIVHDHHYGIYDSKSKAVVLLKKSLNDDFSGHSCPYCGLDTVSHIDHYFPRASFPEFSISRQNLIMSCDICNSGYKGEEWGAGMAQEIIHPRFNDLGVHEYFRAVVSYQEQAIVTSFSVQDNLPLSGLVERHFQFMHLNTRYITKVTLEEVPKMRRILLAEPTVAQGGDRLLKFVQDQIVAHDFNSWQRAFYKSMLAIVAETAMGGL